MGFYGAVCWTILTQRTKTEKGSTWMGLEIQEAQDQRWLSQSEPGSEGRMEEMRVDPRESGESGSTYIDPWSHGEVAQPE